jgi:hypothetical protein
LTTIAHDEMMNEFCLKLQSKLLNNFVDQDFIPIIARECRDELISHQEEELAQRDRHALESENTLSSLLTLDSLILFLVLETLKKYIAPQLLVMHLMMSMMSSFDTVMIHHFTKGIMKRLVAHRLVS